MTLTRLSVNLNKVALVRNSRDDGNPSPVEFGEIALAAGAAGLTVHPRPDERHIRASDVHPLACLVRLWPGREFNIEGNPKKGRYMEHIAFSRPDQATFVPDTDDQKTSDHGCDVEGDASALRELIREAHASGARVSLFMDPVPELMVKAKELGADRIELYTAAYAKAWNEGNASEVVGAYAESTRAAIAAGLGVNAGHDLSLENLEYFLTSCRGVNEVSIGHALISEALRYGMDDTVRRYLEICSRAALV